MLRPVLVECEGGLEEGAAGDCGVPVLCIVGEVAQRVAGFEERPQPALGAASLPGRAAVPPRVRRQLARLRERIQRTKQLGVVQRGCVVQGQRLRGQELLGVVDCLPPGGLAGEAPRAHMPDGDQARVAVVPPVLPQQRQQRVVDGFGVCLHVVHGAQLGGQLPCRRRRNGAPVQDLRGGGQHVPIHVPRDVRRAGQRVLTGVPRQHEAQSQSLRGREAVATCCLGDG